MGKDGGRTAAVNRKARHDFEFLDVYEAGLVLTGTEIKSIRDGKLSLAEAYCRTDGGELFVIGLDIPPYRAGNRHNHNPRRKRKLLLKRREINKITPQLLQRGLTLVPVKLYYSRGWAKLQIAVARGRKRHDKRQVMKRREQEREIQRGMKSHR